MPTPNPQRSPRDDLTDAVELLRGFVADLDPALIDARRAKAHLEGCAEATRLCQAATALLAARVAETKVWADDGARSVAEYLASATGAPIGQAYGMLETAARLSELPATAAAFRSGELSPAQARAVSQAASADPTAEHELLEIAARSSLRGLQDKARSVEAAADPEQTEMRYRRAVENRDLSTWVDVEGSGRLAWRGAPDVLAEITSAIAPYIKHELRAARKAGVDETYAHCAADAFVAMVRSRAGTGDGIPEPAAGRATLTARFDYSAFARGRTVAGEICEIEGVGPVPISVIDQLAQEHPIVHAVLTKGRDVTRVAHLGRSGDTFLKTAIEWRDQRCVIAGCDRADYLETHHRVLVSRGGISSMEQMIRLCGFHHDRHHQGSAISGNHDDGFRMECTPGDTEPAPPDTG